MNKLPLTRRRVYANNNLNLIKQLAADLDNDQIKYLASIIWHGGYIAVRSQIIKGFSRMDDHELLKSQVDFMRVKSRYSSKRGACLILATIWELYYSPLMIEFNPIAEYHPTTAVGLGSDFFSYHEMIIDYWPFEDWENPFHRRHSANVWHCETPI